MNAQIFIDYWSDKGGSERANYQLFINGLCALIGTAPPGAGSEDDRLNDYVYERRVRALDVTGEDGSWNYIDCYKRHCFVLEAKQSRKRQRGPETGGTADLFGAPPAVPRAATASWDRLMKQARAQAERYAKALPADHGWPPFLIVVDVGHAIETYADFTGLGKAYLPFPDSRTHRIHLADLADPRIRERLKAIWEAPNSLDPAAHRAEVTRDIARRLARVARSLEKRHPPKTVALFLMRCLFTAFAEDVGLLKEDGFLDVLRMAEPNPRHLPRYLNTLWHSMDTGNEFDPMIHARVRHFNGGLFRNAEALPLDADEIAELINACKRDWRNVEPAIFGTLLENALDPRERGQLGAHFTPRAYVERLVVPTVIEPLMEEWAGALALAEQARARGDTAGAVAEVETFHRKLCTTRVLDPACGTGNFLYVALELMKKLEGEVLLALQELGRTQANLELAGLSVGPHQFLGLEKNPRAVPIAELVIWLGHLQCHLRERGPESLSEPILKPYDTIREADAVLAWSREELLRDEHGRPLSRWDGVTTRPDPFTGRDVPDETARVELKRYVDPRPADWPEADFVVGNPPFIGGKDLRQELGDGYAEALWAAHPHMPGGADYVMYWWDKAAERVRDKRLRRFGFITTNSITMTFSRRVIQQHLGAKQPLHLAFAIPDHPWADGKGTAAVRIAMTVGVREAGPGVLKTVQSEGSAPDRDGAVSVELKIAHGVIKADLTTGPDVASAVPLRANEGISSRGVSLHGSGFIVTPEQARGLGLGSVPGLEAHIRPYRNGRDLTGRSRGVMVIDLYGLTDTDVRRRFPDVYQWVCDRVKPERDQNNRPTYRDNWWIFGEPRTDLRKMLIGLSRYIATVETAKHRIFQLLDASIRPDNKLIALALDDCFSLGVLSSRIHVAWALAAGALLEDRPVYVKTACFDTFPFPVPTAARRQRIGDLAEEMDALRKEVLAAHGDRLTLTQLYNILEKRRAGEAMTDAERDAYDLGRVGVLLDLHQRIDHAVAEAYGWPAELPESEILARLVALNAERHREERVGLVRWLRPEFQNPDGRAAATQLAASLDVAETAAVKHPWPKTPAEQVRALQALLRSSPDGIEVKAAARRFKGAPSNRVGELLELLASVGRARPISANRYAP